MCWICVQCSTTQDISHTKHSNSHREAEKFFSPFCCTIFWASLPRPHVYEIYRIMEEIQRNEPWLTDWMFFYLYINSSECTVRSSELIVWNTLFYIFYEMLGWTVFSCLINIISLLLLSKYCTGQWVWNIHSYYCIPKRPLVQPTRFNSIPYTISFQHNFNQTLKFQVTAHCPTRLQSTILCFLKYHHWNTQRGMSWGCLCFVIIFCLAPLKRYLSLWEYLRRPLESDPNGNSHNQQPQSDDELKSEYLLNSCWILLIQ